jgi:biotin/methionine sulfoxide reductase
MTRATRRTLTHWGAYDVGVADGKIEHVAPFQHDPEPSAIGQAFHAVEESRVMRPSIRRSWLRDGAGAAPERRGREPFVEVEWDVALDLVAAEIERVRTQHGSPAIYAGSYGWSSAGRFHHAQSQLHRFMNLAGGYTRSVNTYSLAAAEVILPHVIGLDWWSFERGQNSWSAIAANTELFVCFGGIPLKNSQVQSGGIGRHRVGEQLRGLRERGVELVNVSPQRSDLDAVPDVTWVPIRPGTDVAMILGLLHCVVAAGLHDEAFLDRYCVGWDRLHDDIMGAVDGVPKDARWASRICDVPEDQLVELAQKLATRRSLLTASWSVQRAHHGEHAYWAVIALAAALGQIGLPGGGFGFGYGAVGTIGNGYWKVSIPGLPQGRPVIDSFIPVARVSDMLLHPGKAFDYNGRQLTYPEIALVYWAGGNPFHHQMDLNRLRRAWQRPQTIVVHEPFWTATARHADVVFPATTPLERNDLGGASADGDLFAMQQAIEPVGQARDDYDTFSALARRLGFEDEFTEGRTSDEWVRHLYEQLEARDPAHYPPFEQFWATGYIENPESQAVDGAVPWKVLMDDFRRDPSAHPLATPSGRITLHSTAIEEFGYDDCPPHPTWMPPYEWLSPDAPAGCLHLISNQPRTKLHSQWDHGPVSRAGKVDGREPLLIHPTDAADRGIADGQAVLVRNARGACLAGARVTDAVRPGVVVLSTGAWYVPDDADGETVCRHGNPNVLTCDRGTSKLSQGPSAQTCLVEVVVAPEPVPTPRPFQPPAVVDP